jgi:hypothetical protein
MIALAHPAEPRPENAALGEFRIEVDPAAEPTDVDRFVDGLGRLVRRRIKDRRAREGKER